MQLYRAQLSLHRGGDVEFNSVIHIKPRLGTHLTDTAFPSRSAIFGNLVDDGQLIYTVQKTHFSIGRAVLTECHVLDYLRFEHSQFFFETFF